MVKTTLIRRIKDKARITNLETTNPRCMKRRVMGS
jgi:hypothetical protein